MNTQSKCECNTNPTLIFSCSGASDAGELADRTARSLTKEGVGKMYCLSGIGGKVEAIISNTKNAAKILTIDGCPQSCAKKTLEQACFTHFQALELSTIGFKKGHSPATDENIRVVSEKAKQLLAGCGCE